jgi:hypothetical protein
MIILMKKERFILDIEQARNKIKIFLMEHSNFL